MTKKEAVKVLDEFFQSAPSCHSDSESSFGYCPYCGHADFRSHSNSCGWIEACKALEVLKGAAK